MTDPTTLQRYKERCERQCDQLSEMFFESIQGQAAIINSPTMFRIYRVNDCLASPAEAFAFYEEENG